MTAALVRGARAWSFPIELVEDEPFMVHRRPSCIRSFPCGASFVVYPIAVPWWEAVADVALDLAIAVCRECAERAAVEVDAYHLQDDAAA